jgi:DNA-binding NarL/FixJ family response regulator
MKNGKNRVLASRTSSGRTGVIVADTSPIDRAGFTAIIERESDLEVLAEASTVDEAIAACRRHSPDVLLVTLSLQGGNGRGPIPLLIESVPNLRVVAISQHTRDRCLVLNPPHLTQVNGANGHAPASGGASCLHFAVQQGAYGTVRRDDDCHRLIDTIRKVATGERCHAHDDGDCSQSHDCAESPARLLSDRERMVAALIARGHSNKEIGNALDISEATVKKHVGRLLSKLGFLDRLQVGLYLARNPLVLERPSHEVSAPFEAP